MFQLLLGAKVLTPKSVTESPKSKTISSRECDREGVIPDYSGRELDS